MLKMAAFFPHPPIVLPQVGGEESGQVRATYQAMSELAGEIAGVQPDFIAAITPHGHVFHDAIGLTALDRLEGDLGNFGAPGVKVSFPLARDALESVLEKCRSDRYFCFPLDRENLRQYRLSHKLDHGLVIPLYFIAQAGWQGDLLPVNMAFLPYEELYDFGAALSRALDELGKNWVLLISGDLSHRLLPQAPAGYSPQGAVFDEILRQSIREGDVKRVIHLDKDLIEEAGQCGLRPLVMGLGALDGYEIKGKELSYEGPFGVGYLVARLEKGKRREDRLLVDTLYGERQQHLQDRRQAESPLVSLARRSIREYLTTGRFPDNPPDLPGEAAWTLSKQAGAFVSLKKFGQLRGCIGTIAPTRPNLAQEIIHNAIAAASSDPRFEPLEPEELDQLEISVDVLGQPEQISSIEELDPKIYGVIVSKGTRKGLLLPDLPGITAAREQVRIAKEKAGIAQSEKADLARFKVDRYY